MKGIIIASFGSIYQDAVEKSIGSIEKKVRSMYSDMEVRRVFLSDALWKSGMRNMMKRFLLSQKLCKILLVLALMRYTFNL